MLKADCAAAAASAAGADLRVHGWGGVAAGPLARWSYGLWAGRNGIFFLAHSLVRVDVRLIRSKKPCWRVSFPATVC